MELELKFALPALEPMLLEKQLARVGSIGRRRPVHKHLHNTYYDTRDHALQANGLALRIRQMGDDAKPRWVQTLKAGGAALSALSRRGEWEISLTENVLDAVMLHDTPWMEFDPEGNIFEALEPVFTTTFERLCWVIKKGDASVEIALDRGNVLMDGLSAPLCELEIELLSGPPDVLFDIAAAIAQHMALMPLHMSKAERAYRLAQGTVEAPLRAKPPALSEELEFVQTAQTVLRECFLQFTANLNSLRTSDAPEVLHQARVGWRRFKSALKFFRQLGEGSTFPVCTPIKPLLQGLTALRDLDVAATEVFPLHARAYQQNDALRIEKWRLLDIALVRERAEQRELVRQMLADPAVGRTLLQITRWLETDGIAPPHAKHKPKDQSNAKWVNKRMAQLAERLDAMPTRSKDPAVQHEVRILAKRLRYGVESLRSLLPKKRSERWLRIATRHQTDIGMERDRQQAVLIAQRLQAAEGIVEFMRGAMFAAISPGV